MPVKAGDFERIVISRGEPIAGAEQHHHRNDPQADDHREHGDLDGGLQWVDFVVRAKGKRAAVLILDDPSKRWKSYEKEYHKNKLAGLDQQGVPYKLLKKGMSSQEYQIVITWFMRKVK